MSERTHLAAILSVIMLLLAATLLFVPVQGVKAEIAGLPNVYVNGATGNDSYTGGSVVFVSGNIGPKKTIAAGITAVAIDGTVNVAAGTYYEHGLHLSSDMNLVGESASTTIIDGGASGCVLMVSSLPYQHNTISRLTIQNGAAVPLPPPQIQNGVNVSDNFGGGIYISSSHIVTINDCAIINNTKLAFANPLVTNNNTKLATFLLNSGIGAGICNDGGTLYMNRCTVSGNTAAYGGGGIYTCSTPGAPIVNNSRPSNSIEAAFGLVELTDCTISGNTVMGGPLVENNRSGNTVAGLAGRVGCGGGIYCEANATVRLLNVTIAGNTVTGSYSKGGGFANSSADSFYFKNCIVANNTAGNGVNNNGFDASGTGAHSEGYNIDSENTCYFIQDTDQRTTNPQLGPLQNNGGSTSTHAITAASPAYNRGTCAAPSWGAVSTTDQRGVSRPQGAACDIGAFELMNTATGTGAVSFNSSSGIFTSLNPATTTACGTLPGYSFPHGFFSYSITGIATGSTVTITITLPANIAAGAQYWKCINGQWVNLTSRLGHNNGDNILTLDITDGGLGDADGLPPNGTIVDPGGPAVRVVPVAATTTSPRRDDASSSPQMQDKPMTSAARLSVKYLNVQPQQAQANQPVTIYANIANGGDEAGNYTATLKVNGMIEATRTGKVGGHAAIPLTFEVIKDKAGTYTVDINGQQASFIIVDDGGTKHNISTRSWAMVGFFLSAIGVIVVLALLMRRRLTDY